VDPDLACRELVELVTDYLEAALPTAERERLEAHLADCECCDAYIEQVRATIALVGRIRELEERPEIHALLRAFREHTA
jgi:anti-sigma factor RsiW